MLWLAWFIIQLIIWSIWAVINYKTKASNYLLLSIVVVTGLIDAVRVDKDFIKTAYKSKYFSEHEELDRIKQEFEKRPFRCFPLPGTFDVNQLGKEGLESVQGRHDNELRIYRNFRGGEDSRNLFTGLIERNAGGQEVLVPSMLRQGNPFIDLLNVKYLLLRNQGKIMEFENQNTLGRISYLQDYTLMQEDEILDALENNGYDYRTTGALLREPGQDFSPGNGDPEDLSVEWKSYTPNYREAVVSVPDNGLLRFSEIYYPGWEIRIDGKEKEIFRSDYALFAVPVSKGEHRVEMMPKSLYLGTAAWITIPLFFIFISYWIYLLVSWRRVSKEKENRGNGSRE